VVAQWGVLAVIVVAQWGVQAVIMVAQWGVQDVLAKNNSFFLHGFYFLINILKRTSFYL
jgi:hypothetical protein